MLCFFKKRAYCFPIPHTFSIGNFFNDSLIKSGSVKQKTPLIGSFLAK